MNKLMNCLFSNMFIEKALSTFVSMYLPLTFSDYNKFSGCEKNGTDYTLQTM